MSVQAVLLLLIFPDGTLKRYACYRKAHMHLCADRYRMLLYYDIQVDVENILWCSWYSSDHWRGN